MKIKYFYSTIVNKVLSNDHIFCSSSSTRKNEQMIQVSAEGSEVHASQKTVPREPITPLTAQPFIAPTQPWFSHVLTNTSTKFGFRIYRTNRSTMKWLSRKLILSHGNCANQNCAHTCRSSGNRLLSKYLLTLELKIRSHNIPFRTSHARHAWLSFFLPLKRIVNTCPSLGNFPATNRWWWRSSRGISNAGGGHQNGARKQPSRYESPHFHGAFRRRCLTFHRPTRCTINSNILSSNRLIRRKYGLI